MNFAKLYADKAFEATILKQREKIDKGDILDLKITDVNLIKDIYPAFDGATPETDEVYALILETFPN